MSTAAPTPNEVKVKLEVMGREIDSLKTDLRTLESKVAVLDTRTSINERDINNIHDQLRKIDNNTTWILRLIIGAIVLAVIGLVIKGMPA